jgi:hypothetical protein
MSAIALFIGVVGWACFFYSQSRWTSGDPQPPFVGYGLTTNANADTGNEKFGSGNTSSYVRSAAPQVERAAWPAASASASAPASGESPASIVAREWKMFASVRDAGVGKDARDRGAPKDVVALKEVKVKPQPAKQQIASAAPVKQQAVNPPPVAPQPASPVRVASLDTTLPQVAPSPVVAPIPSNVPANVEAKTNIVDFATAPFPYQGGKIHFRKKVSWHSRTFSDDHVLLHIPPGFDPKRPAVMVVFFHGHGATLARDVRDRQRLPAQITESGANAVLVAPQFAYDAANSSPGKFGDTNGFKRFLDEASTKLAALYGDIRTERTFAAMPIVLISYSGGFGPTLAVLDRGGANARIHGLVLMDSIYSGVDTFADWIANHRQNFFVSSFTPHLARRNAELQSLLREKDVPFNSELRRTHLQGMVTFLPAGPISHRDFLTHGWADNPVVDVLARMDDIDQNIRTAAGNAATASITPALAVSKRN